MRATLLLVSLLAVWAGPVAAHGEKGHGAPVGAQKRKALSILSPAEAAARIETDAAAGFRFIAVEQQPPIVRPPVADLDVQGIAQRFVAGDEGVQIPREPQVVAHDQEV